MCAETFRRVLCAMLKIWGECVTLGRLWDQSLGLLRRCRCVSLTHCTRAYLNRCAHPHIPSRRLYALTMASSDVVGVTEHVHAPSADGSGIDPYGVSAASRQRRTASSLRARASPPPPRRRRAAARAELVWCATGGDLSRVSEILTAHPEMVDQGDEDSEGKKGRRALLRAVWRFRAPGRLCPPRT